MKLALVAEWLDPWRGGAETSTLQFLHHLMDQDAEVHLFTRSRPASAPRFHVHTISGASMSRTRRSVTFAHRVERALRADSFDVIHAISPCRGAAIYQPRGGTVAESVARNLALTRSSPGRAVKKYANRLNLKQRYMLAMERRIMRDAEGPVVVAISDYVVDQLKRHYGLPARRIRKIYNGVDPDPVPVDQRSARRAGVRREFGIADHESLALLVAHNFRLKGVQRWMEAFALLIRRGVNDVRSIVIGKGESPRWHRLAARLGIADRLLFIGPSERVRDFYHAADVLVHPTYYDPCSRVVLEALTAGLPCITTRWDGGAEMIRDGQNGFVLADPGDVPVLADRVEALRDPSLRTQFRQAAIATASQISMARHTSAMMDLYRELCPVRGAKRIPAYDYSN